MTEDLSVLFEDLGVEVTLGANTFKALFDMPDEIIGGGLVQSTEYLLTVASSNVSSANSGDALSIEGVSYEIRSIRQIDDGRLSRVSLSKV